VWDRAGAETPELFERVTRQLGQAGAVVQDFALPPAFDALEAAHAVIMNAESARALGWEMTTALEQLSPVLRERMEWGLAQPEAALVESKALFRFLQNAFTEMMGGFDFLLTPAAPGEAPLGLAYTGDASFNFIWTSLHVPCVTVPALVGPHGMPLGVQIVAPRGRDREALAWAAWVAGAVG